MAAERGVLSAASQGADSKASRSDLTRGEHTVARDRARVGPRSQTPNLVLLLWLSLLGRRMADRVGGNTCTTSSSWLRAVQRPGISIFLRRISLVSLGPFCHLLQGDLLDCTTSDRPPRGFLAHFPSLSSSLPFSRSLTPHSPLSGRGKLVGCRRVILVWVPPEANPELRSQVKIVSWEVIPGDKAGERGNKMGRKEPPKVSDGA